MELVPWSGCKAHLGLWMGGLWPGFSQHLSEWPTHYSLSYLTLCCSSGCCGALRVSPRLLPVSCRVGPSLLDLVQLAPFQTTGSLHSLPSFSCVVLVGTSLSHAVSSSWREHCLLGPRVLAPFVIEWGSACLFLHTGLWLQGSADFLAQRCLCCLSPVSGQGSACPKWHSMVQVSFLHQL